MNSATPVLDEDTLRIARQAFQWVRSGNLDALQHLLDHGLRPNLRNEQGDSLLMLAAYHGHAAVVRALLDAGANPELRNDRGQSPLAGAAYKGHAEVVRLLLDHGAEVDAQGPDGRTALMTAAMFNRTALVDLLLARGAQPGLRDAAGWRAEDAALHMGAEEAAAQLRAAG
jgi:hypothetical protein